MTGWTLDYDWALRHLQMTLLVPTLDGGDWLFLFVRGDPAISVQLLTKNITDRLRQLEESGNDTWPCHDYLPVFKFKAAPAFAYHNKVWKFTPKLTTKLYEERIGIRFHTVCLPVPIVLIPNNDLSVHNLLRGVCVLTIHINSGQLLKIRFQYLGPGLPIIQVNAIDACLRGKGDNLIH